MIRNVAGALVFTLLASVVPAVAADREAEVSGALTATAAAAVPPLAADVDWSLPRVQIRGAKRGALLPALYVGLAGLNAFDVYSTSKGLANGATEANPMMRSMARNPGAMLAIKGGVTAATIVLAERLWRQDRRVAAITMMVISNGVMATVAARNASVLGRMR